MSSTENTSVKNTAISLSLTGTRKMSGNFLTLSKVRKSEENFAEENWFSVYR